MGAQMLREVASKQNDKAGDGTTTATVLAQSIVREGSKAVAAGMNPMDLKRGIDLAVGAVVQDRSEEHTSELQSLMRSSYAVFCLKKTKTIYDRSHIPT